MDSSGDRVDEDDDELEFEYIPSSMGQSVQLRCVVKPVRPEPEMTVRFQDGSFINVTFIEDSDDPYPFIDAGIAADGENAYKADFLYYPQVICDTLFISQTEITINSNIFKKIISQPSHDGKILECVVEHETLTAGELPPAKYNVTVTGKFEHSCFSFVNVVYTFLYLCSQPLLTRRPLCCPTPRMWRSGTTQSKREQPKGTLHPIFKLLFLFSRLKVSLTCNPYAETLLWRGPGISSEGLSAFGEEEDPADQGVSGRASKVEKKSLYKKDKWRRIFPLFFRAALTPSTAATGTATR